MKLADYPYVVVRIACQACRRQGRFRLARLAEAHGADCPLEVLLDRLTVTCGYRYRRVSHPRAQEMARCYARFVDLDRPTPPDLPPGTTRLHVIEGGAGGPPKKAAE